MRRKYLTALFEKERNVLLNYFAKKSTPLAKKAAKKAPTLVGDIIELILSAFLIYRARERMKAWYQSQIEFLASRAKYLEFCRATPGFVKTH